MSTLHRYAYRGRPWRALWACLVVLAVFANNAGVARAYEVDRLRAEYRTSVSDLARERVLLAAEFAGARDAGAPNPFSASRYRVVAKLLDDAMMVRWLGARRFAVVHDYFKRRR